jgi:hypothetical protein
LVENSEAVKVSQQAHSTPNMFGKETAGRVRVTRTGDPAGSNF